MALHLRIRGLRIRETQISENHQPPNSELRRSLGRGRKRDEARQGLVNSGDSADLPVLPFEFFGAFAQRKFEPQKPSSEPVVENKVFTFRAVFTFNTPNAWLVE